MASPALFRPAFLALPFALLLGACQTKPATPASADGEVLTPATFPDAYADRVLVIADASRDGTVTLVEWTNAGGDKRSFEMVDADKDGVVTRTELRRFGDNVKLFDFTRRHADFNKDNRMTRREFRTASGVSVLRITF